MRDAIGAWRLCDVDPGAGDIDRLARGAGEGWIATKASEDTYHALIAAGRLADPYRGRSEADAAWVRDRDWWWHAPLSRWRAGSGGGDHGQLLEHAALKKARIGAQSVCRSR